MNWPNFLIESLSKCLEKNNLYRVFKNGLTKIRGQAQNGKTNRKKFLYLAQNDYESLEIL